MTDRVLLRGRELAVWRGDRCLFEQLHFDLGPEQLALLVGREWVGQDDVAADSRRPRVADGGERDLERRRRQRACEPRSAPRLLIEATSEALKRDLTVEENLDFHATLLGTRVEIRSRSRGTEAGQGRSYACALPVGGSTPARGARDAAAIGSQALVAGRAYDEPRQRRPRVARRMDTAPPGGRRACGDRDRTSPTSSQRAAHW